MEELIGDNSIIYTNMRSMRYMSVMVFLWLLLNVLWCNGCWEQEKIALLQLKQFYDDSSGLFNWNEGGGPSTLDCCEWRRIECNSTTGRVIILSLDLRMHSHLSELYLNASYFLPFEELRILDLSYNRIRGCLEKEGFERLSRLSNLEFLDLTGNMLDNTVISSLGSLSSLKVLNLSSNLLSGTIDTQELNKLSNLKKLDMGDNQIEDFASSKGAEPLLQLFDLEVLKLRANSFNNTILSSLIELSHLKYLDLAENQLTGSIHVKELKALTNLEELYMGNIYVEEFVGPEDKRTLNNLQILGLEHLQSSKSLVIRSLGTFSSLKKLYLRDNNLNRTMNLLELANLSTVQELVLDNSVLHKDFLQSIGSLTSLRILHLDNCSLKGNLPSQGWCELKNLQELYLNNNKLEGTLPLCLANLSSLHVLDLSYNQFIGNIASTSIGMLMSIEDLLLGFNHFQIPISFEPFSNCSNLKHFSSEDNELTIDSISKIWTPTFQLQDLNLWSCTLYQSIVKLPDFLYYQFDLRHFDLSNINFGVILPSWLLENNTRMESFSSSNNSHTGLFQLPSRPNPNLLYLDISKNRLRGQIPSNLSTIFPNLSILFAFQNAFQGNIPPSLGEMKSLASLDLSNNNLSGKIPERFFEQQSSLEALELSNNKLWGPVFPSNFSSTTLELFISNNNSLVGEIPDLSSSKYLTFLDIGNNLLTGKLPKSMEKLSNLEHIVVANNNLEGDIPLELCQLYYLQNLVLSENNFFGSVPSCLSQLQYLQCVRLNKNKLTRLMPYAFMDSRNLILLDLTNNNFTGTIPNWIGNLSSLRILLLKGNHFHSEIPTTLCQLNRLAILDLSSNSLSGHLPPCLGNLTMIKVAMISYRFLGEVVEFTSKRRLLNYTGNFFYYMHGIDLSHNHFIGEIPVEFGNLSNVRGLNLSLNNLTGLIPASLSNLKQLESLDLSYNDLNGQIPYQLTELNSLEVFSVAYNNLSGPLPDMKAQFGTFDERSYEGNVYLCGPPLINSCNKTSPTSPNLDSFDGDNKDGGLIDIYDFYVSFAAAYVVVLLAIAMVLWINPYWRLRWFYVIEVIRIKCYYFFVDMFY